MKTKTDQIVAVDVAKEQLEVLLPPGRRLRVSNDARGLRALLRQLKALERPWVFCEASGGYERALLQRLHREHITVTLLNPARVRAFARSEGVKAKNDPIDTRMIARFAREKDLAPTPPPPHPHLTALMDRRRHLAEQLKREKTRLRNCPACIQASIRRMIALLQRELQKLEKTIREQLKEKPRYRQAAALMRTIQGVGEVTSWSILAYLPEITQLSRNRVAALAGLAPYDQDSGSSHGPRQICGGRHKVRAALYMAALVAAKHNPHIRAYVTAALRRGKNAKWTVVAAMRKILMHIHATLQKGQITLVA